MFWLQLLQIIAIIANFAQIFGVVWVFLFGGKAAIDVVRDISRHQPINVSAATIRNVLLALIFLALISSGSILNCVGNQSLVS